MNAKSPRFIPSPLYETVTQNKDAKARATIFAKQLLEVRNPQKTGDKTITKAGIYGQSVCRSVIGTTLIIYQ